MKFQGITGNFTEAAVDALAVAVFKGEKSTSGVLKDLDKLTGGLITSVFKSEEFKGDKGETALLRFAPAGAVKAGRLMLIGVGAKTDYSASDVSAVSGTATRFLRCSHPRFGEGPIRRSNPSLVPQACRREHLDVVGCIQFIYL